MLTKKPKKIIIQDNVFMMFNTRLTRAEIRGQGRGAVQNFGGRKVKIK